MARADVFNSSRKVEGSGRQIVMLAVEDFLAAAKRVQPADKTSGPFGVLLSHEEGLGKEIPQLRP